MEVVEGAEARLEFTDDRVLKKRVRKKYRHPELDEKIREERTEKEARIMRDARENGVTVPRVDRATEDTLKIEKLQGEQLKDVLENNLDAMEELGENTAKLHEGGIIHGDLTTRNALLGNQLYLIDFGLAFRSERTEDRAIDIHLLKQVLESSHPEVAKEAWERFLDGYREFDGSGEVLERLEEVEQRGRYK
ncbi:MAG: KEOPS complex kinase/ATPase Bud32 [Candidatus Nanohaloarchaea archaeon]